MDRNHRRPTCPTSGSDRGATVTTPHAATMIQLLGPGASHENILLSRDEYAALQRAYGFTTEKSNPKPPPPEAPVRETFKSAWEYEGAVNTHERAMDAWRTWTDPQPMMQAGADRNLMRYALADGLRIMAWLARYVPRDEDPLKQVILAAVEAGWDVDPSDIAWADAFDDDQDGEQPEAEETA